MAKQNQRRVLRNYRGMSPTKFHAFNQRVRNGLADNQKIPEATWAANPALPSSYMSASEKHDAVFHQAVYGSRLDIAERELLQAQLVGFLDEIASVLEAAAIHVPDILLSSGFDLNKEQRARPRTNVAHTDSVDVKGQLPA